MSQATSSRSVPRSIVAVLAGMFAGILLSLGTDEVFHLARVFPPWGASMVGYQGALLAATIYRTIYGVAGSYIAARFAPRSPMFHALVLGVLGFAVSILGAVTTWNRGPAFGPHWYPVALVVLALPTAWLGGKLRVVQLRPRSDG
ncbi:MAG: hypothetical protein WCE61_13005 [Candidatus Acidiferrum sp.]